MLNKKMQKIKGNWSRKLYGLWLTMNPVSSSPTNCSRIVLLREFIVFLLSLIADLPKRNRKNLFFFFFWKDYEVCIKRQWEYLDCAFKDAVYVSN